MVEKQKKPNTKQILAGIEDLAFREDLERLIASRNTLKPDEFVKLAIEKAQQHRNLTLTAQAIAQIVTQEQVLYSGREDSANQRAATMNENKAFWKEKAREKWYAEQINGDPISTTTQVARYIAHHGWARKRTVGTVKNAIKGVKARAVRDAKHGKSI